MSSEPLVDAESPVISTPELTPEPSVETRTADVVVTVAPPTDPISAIDPDNTAIVAEPIAELAPEDLEQVERLAAEVEFEKTLIQYIVGRTIEEASKAYPGYRFRATEVEGNPCAGEANVDLKRVNVHLRSDMITLVEGFG